MKSIICTFIMYACIYALASSGILGVVTSESFLYVVLAIIAIQLISFAVIIRLRLSKKKEVANDEEN